VGDARFYVEILTDAVVRLPAEEAHHACRSRRLREGDAVIVFDGRGHEAAGTILSASKARVEVRIGEVVERPRPRPALTLAVAMPKGPRQETLIEKCTELGTAEIVPLITQRSVATPSDHRLDKWRRTTIEAAKQSDQCWLPVLSPPRRLEEVLADATAFEHHLVAAPGAGTMLDWAGVLAGSASVLAFIGPEGGWTGGELNELTAAGCRPVSLGPHVLRIETAAIAIAALVHGLARDR
jgi:16S rRNA (uracil1498-N3)-methyltransferase